jgi:hypothetical protein
MDCEPARVSSRSKEPIHQFDNEAEDYAADTSLVVETIWIQTAYASAPKLLEI